VTAIDVAKSWYVPPDVRPRYGWLVFSLDFVLASLQGSITDPQNIRRTPTWVMLASIVSALMAVVQTVIMILSATPIVSWFMETLARVFTRNAAGFFLRSCYWKARLKYLGPDTLIDQGVEIWGPANVSIGSNCHIDTNVRLAAGERRHKQKGFITIGNYVHLGPGVHIAGRGGVEIRDFVGIMSNAHLYSATGVVERPADPGQLISMSHMAPPDQQHVYEAPIFIDHYAFIGMMTRIMPGVKVGFGAVVHANCELTRDVPPFANVGGVARGRQIGWRRPRRPSTMLKTEQPPPATPLGEQPHGAQPPSADGKPDARSAT
jgi:acetyltransferase-like isoleucine patch superfamily enzyme